MGSGNMDDATAALVIEMREREEDYNNTDGTVKRL